MFPHRERSDMFEDSPTTPTHREVLGTSLPACLARDVTLELRLTEKQEEGGSEVPWDGQEVDLKPQMTFPAPQYRTASMCGKSWFRVTASLASA